MDAKNPDTAEKPAARMPSRGSIAGQELTSFIDRIERLEAVRKEAGDDIKLVKAEAKARGYDVQIIGQVLKVRKAKPGELDEARTLLDLYLNAIGMKAEAPLFRSVGLLAVDRTAREQVIDVCKMLVPDNGEIIIKVGGAAIRLWRSEDGKAYAEDYREPERGEVERPSAPVPRPPSEEVPDCSPAAAEELGAQAYRDNVPIVRNPFPWDDKRRQRWDLGWRKESGSDGMGPQP